MTNNTNNGRKPDIYTRITSQIIAALEQGVKPWTQTLYMRVCLAGLGPGAPRMGNVMRS